MRVAKRFALLILTGCAALSLAGYAQNQPADPPPNSLNVTTPIEISPKDIPGHLVNTHYVSPYQAQIKAFHITGAVLLEIIIDETGKVTDVKLLQSTDKRLNKAAVDMVQHWSLTPYTHKGVPTAVVTTVTMNFAPGRED